MGVIEDGSVSGCLPSNGAFAVHYPGYPSSMARAIETLGGTQAIRKVRSSQSNKLELHFRPEDPYSHPAFGEIQPCNNFLLRISREKSTDGKRAEVSNEVSKCPSTDSTNLMQKNFGSESAGSGQHGSQLEGESAVTEEEVKAQVSGEVPIKLCADIIAKVSEAYHFNGMVDYQHVLPVHADVARRKKRSWAEVEPHIEKGELVDVDQEDLMMLVPQLFSQKDVPEKLVLRPSMTLNLKKKQEGVVQQRWEMGIEPCLAIDFEVKEIPKKVNWEQYISRGSQQWEWQMAVSNLFDEKPIWPKGQLIERLLDKGLIFGNYTLRRLLFRTAYYFSNGPFMRFWIRKGYDPRKNPDSCIYQRIDFRVPPSLRSYCDANAANGLKQRWEDICSFRVFPYKCQATLQLFEVVDDYIQQEIRKPLKQTTCTGATGWFSFRELESLRLRLMVRFLSVYPGKGAEGLLKSASDRFEKSKRILIYENSLRPNEEGIQEVNKELEGDKDKEDNDVELEGDKDKEDNAVELEGDKDKEDPNDMDDDEEDEMEAENGEEELDAYEALHMAGEDEDSLQSHSYINTENISRDYLQGLFGSFSFTKASDGEVQDPDTSDGEYQIYEQDSLGEYSDEDDY